MTNEVCGNTVFLRLKGYSSMNTKEGSNKYNTAKQPAQQGWNSQDFKGLSSSEASDWLGQGGWLGMRIPEGVIVVDIDNATLGNDLFFMLENEGYNFYCIKTPNGFQFFFADCKAVKTQGVKEMTGLGVVVDYRLTGKGYIVYPTANTENRKWEREAEGALSELPYWLCPIKGNSDSFQLPVIEGERNDSLHSHCWRLLRNGYTNTQVEEVINLVNRYFTDAALENEELDKLIQSAFKGYTEKHGNIGNVNEENVTNQNSKRVEHVAVAKQILQEIPCIFDGTQLYIYRSGVYSCNSKPVLEKRIHEVLGTNATIHHVKEVYEWLRRESYVDPNSFNPDDGILNVANGLLNLNTGELLPHTADRYSTIQIPVKYDPKADCPAIKRFLIQIVEQDVVPILEELFGYTLMANCKYEKAFMFVGNGANGKSTLLKLLEAFIGCENVSNVSLQAIDEHRFAKIKLKGKLLNIDDDLPAKTLRESGEFKKVVSGSPIEAEYKGKDMEKFTPTAKLVFSANTLPRNNDNSPGFWRRWIVVQFPHTFGGSSIDRGLLSKLTTPQELSGLLNIALTGLNRLIKQNGFSESQSTNRAISKWKYTNDTVQQFIDECCIDKGCTSKVDLHLRYRAFTVESGLTPFGRNEFYEKLATKMNLTECRIGNTRAFEGVSLVNCSSTLDSVSNF